MDTTPPQAGAATDVGSAWTTSTRVHVTTAATDALTGTTHVRLSNVGWTDVNGELQPGASFPAGVEMPVPWDFSPAAEVYVQWQNAAGSWSGPITLRVHWDAAPPQVTDLRVNLQRDGEDRPLGRLTDGDRRARPTGSATANPRPPLRVQPASCVLAEMRVIDASKDGAPVCIDAFTVLR